MPKSNVNQNERWHFTIEAPLVAAVRTTQAQKHHDPRSYALLEELDVRPRTRYLTRLKNRSA